MDPNRRAVWVAAALYTSMESVLRAVPTTNVLTQRYMERYLSTYAEGRRLCADRHLGAMWSLVAPDGT